GFPGGSSRGGSLGAPGAGGGISGGSIGVPKAIRIYIATLRWSPISGRVPVTAAVAIFTYEITLPGESQNSASSGVILRTRMFGSSALFHQALAGVENSSLILARSLSTTAVPVTETYFWPPASANERLTDGSRAISSSLWWRASVRK